MSNTDHQKISDAVHAAEAGTSGEIVTIIADRSDKYHDVGLHYAVLAMLLVPILFSAFPRWPHIILDTLMGRWDAHSDASRYLLIFALMALAFLIVRYSLAYMPWRLALTPPATKRRRVHARALDLFRVGAESRTIGRTGILIYLSMGEHMAEIVADQAIHAKVAPEAWGDAMAAMIADVRHGRVTKGMVAAIEQVGVILHTHLPRQDDDVNELPDRLIEL